MKQKDIALIIVIVFASGIVSLVVSRLVFAPPKNRQQQVEVVDAISADFPDPDAKYFNKNAIDPTQLIKIGDSTNPNPFNGATQ
ncbi:MAG TPA: hypothetical protein VMY99_00240 [Nevskiaceae bacterium]|nr:hypothetical protein [Nevskiaceae bacterium]